MVNAAHRSGFDLSGTADVVFFAPRASVGDLRRSRSTAAPQRLDPSAGLDLRIGMLYLQNVATSQAELLDRLDCAQHWVNVFGSRRAFRALRSWLEAVAGKER
jgi:hypothetical protein